MINGKIKASMFEQITVRLLEILSPELANQGITIDLWMERFIPFSESELPAVNISFVGGVHEQSTQQYDVYTHSYNIDVYVAKDNELNNSIVLKRGDVLSRLELKKILGIIRAILSNSLYRRLNFEPGLIQTTKLPNIDIAEGDAKNGLDGANISMGRLLYSAKAVEQTILEEGILIGGSDIVSKLEETDKGYKFISNY